jgi:hypothetical protein
MARPFPNPFGKLLLVSLVLAFWPKSGSAFAQTAKGDAARGFEALTTRSFVPGQFPRAQIDNAWKLWGLPEKPANYAELFRERYGLAEAPYANNGLPMGLKTSKMPLGTDGASLDCLTCHGGSLLGKPFPGLGNTMLDLQAIFEELSSRGTKAMRTPYTFCNTRGTNEAGATSVYLAGLRNPDLTLRLPWRNLGLHDELCEDVPAWWHLKRKKTMYATAEADARSVRSIMQFMMHPLNLPGAFEREQAAFRDIQAWILSVEAPKWPWELDREKVARGQILHKQHCAKCHGTKDQYPNKVIPLEEIGTDTTRYMGIESAFGDFYNQSWFSRDLDGWFGEGYKARRSGGYQAPPLDGIWATAPYLHNGSVPTLEALLNSGTRPTVFTRSFRTHPEDYDQEKVGWKTTIPMGPSPTTPIDARRIYDTSKPGRGNKGHTYGDILSPAERSDLIEFLKSL